MYHPDTVTSPTYSNDDDIYDRNFAKRRCCFWLPFLNTEPSPSNRGSDVWQRIRRYESTPNTATTSAAESDSSWARRWRTVRGWSGPGKALLRKFKRKRRANKYGRLGKFQYDPASYALNFDEGPGQNGLLDEDIVARAFSSRYSLPPSAKSSLDFDREGMTFM